MFIPEKGQHFHGFRTPGAPSLRPILAPTPQADQLGSILDQLAPIRFLWIVLVLGRRPHMLRFLCTKFEDY